MDEQDVVGATTINGRAPGGRGTWKILSTWCTVVAVAEKDIKCRSRLEPLRSLNIFGVGLSDHSKFTFAA